LSLEYLQPLPILLLRPTKPLDRIADSAHRGKGDVWRAFAHVDGLIV